MAFRCVLLGLYFFLNLANVVQNISLGKHRHAFSNDTRYHFIDKSLIKSLKSKGLYWCISQDRELRRHNLLASELSMPLCFSLIRMHTGLCVLHFF